MPGCKHRRHNCGDVVCVEAANHGSDRYRGSAISGPSWRSAKITAWRKAKAWKRQHEETEETYNKWLEGLPGQI